VTPLKLNLKSKEARFLTKQISRNENEDKKINKKTMQNKKEIAIKRIMTKFNTKTN
jgi:hypothetical protein